VSSRIVAVLGLLLLAGPLLAASDRDINDLQTEGHLQIDASLAPQDNIVPGQKVILTLKIATDTWFSGGTRISLPEIPGLVILQTEQFASNASESRGGRSWVVQRWSLDIYPQRAGDFTLPPIAARVKINSGAGDDIEGVLYSPAVNFSVTLPASLAGIERWVAAPAFTVNQTFDRALEGLQVGDAFEREIVFQASDILAMMLPAVELADLPGLSTYPSPPVLDNSNNRGQTRASRSQRISYVLEAEGEYRLPALEYFWWDTDNDRLELLSLPPIEFTVGAGAAQADGGGVEIPQLSRRQLLLGTGSLLLFAGLVSLAWKLLPRIPLQRIAAGLAGLWRKLLDLRKPGLPPRLNPDSSAGD
jgi:hypothetical protein